MSTTNGNGRRVTPRTARAAATKKRNDLAAAITGAEFAAIPLTERIPPQNIEAEKAVLGGAMLDKEAIEKAREILVDGPDDFYRQAHGMIWEAICYLADRDEPVDVVTLKDELIRRRVLDSIGEETEQTYLDSVGGLAYVFELADFVPTSANAVFYANMVRDCSVSRKLLVVAGNIATAAFRGDMGGDDQRETAERLVLAVGASRIKDNFQHVGAIACEIEDEVDRRHHIAMQGGEAAAMLAVTGIESGFIALDMMTGGYQPGDLIIKAARPSMGKTANAVQVGAHAALENDELIALFSAEMKSDLVTQRMICSEARVDSALLRTGRLMDDDWERFHRATQRILESRIFIDDETTLSAADVRARCRRLQAKQGRISMVIVDYVQLLQPLPGTHHLTTNDQLTATIKALKNVGREFQCPIIVLSQLSRAVERREDKRPMLSDLRDSGGLEAEADLVEFLYRPAYYAQKKALERGETVETTNKNGMEECELIIGKARNGPTGIVKLGFFPNYTRFENIDRYHKESPF